MEVGKIERKTVKTEFRWEIDFKFLKKRKVGEYLLSPKFFDEDNSCISSWQFRLYPNGNIDYNKDFFSLYIYNLCSDPVTATYSFSFINNEGLKKNKSRPVKFSFSPVETSGNHSGFPRYSSKNLIWNLQNEFIVDHKITISFKVAIKEQAVKNQKEVQNKVDPIKCEPEDYAEKLLTTEAFSDVTLTAEGKNFYLHKCILSTRSIVFEAMFKSHMEENQSVVTIEDTKHDVLEELFRYMYTEKISNSAQCKVWDLHAAAEKYCVEGLKKQCEDMINSMSRDNVIEYLNLAIANNAKSIETNFIKFVAMHLKDFIDKPEFKKFSIQYPEVAFEITSKHFSINK